MLVIINLTSNNKSMSKDNCINKEQNIALQKIIYRELLYLMVFLNIIINVACKKDSSY